MEPRQASSPPYDPAGQHLPLPRLALRPYAEVWYVNPSDFDGYCSRAIIMCIKDFKRKNNGKDLTESPRAIRRLDAQLQAARLCLHHWPSVYVDLDVLFDQIDYTIHFARGSRVHGCDEWGFTVPDDPVTPRPVSSILAELSQHT